MKEREDRAARRVEETKRRTSGTNSDTGNGGITAVKRSDNPQAVVSSPLQPPKVGKSASKSIVELRPRTKTRMRSGRQSSGEVLRNVFESGISGIRRMGRRVTGGGASNVDGSCEDLTMV